MSKILTAATTRLTKRTSITAADATDAALALELLTKAFGHYDQKDETSEAQTLIWGRSQIELVLGSTGTLSVYLNVPEMELLADFTVKSFAEFRKRLSLEAKNAAKKLLAQEKELQANRAKLNVFN